MRILGQVVSAGKLAALAALVGLTALPFVSCSAGPMKVEFQGHELLRNAPPAAPEGGPSRSGSTALFDGDDRWLHVVYLLAVGAAVAGLVVARRPAVVVAAAGLIATSAFLVGFRQKLRSGFEGGREISAKDGPSMRLEVGAYVTLAGFVVGIVDARRRGRGGRSG